MNIENHIKRFVYLQHFFFIFVKTFKSEATFADNFHRPFVRHGKYLVERLLLFRW